MNNIAEGFESGTSQSLIRYFQIAKGSAAEVRSMLILGMELGYIPQESMRHHRFTDSPHH